MFSYFARKKHNIGEMIEVTQFLKLLSNLGHEIAHHGSDHGRYINPNNTATHDNWIHEWALFNSVNEGVEVVLKGVKCFKECCDIDIVGGKYCGYVVWD